MWYFFDEIWLKTLWTRIGPDPKWTHFGGNRCNIHWLKSWKGMNNLLAADLHYWLHILYAQQGRHSCCRQLVSTTLAQLTFFILGYIHIFFACSKKANIQTEFLLKWETNHAKFPSSKFRHSWTKFRHSWTETPKEKHVKSDNFSCLHFVDDNGLHSWYFVWSTRTNQILMKLRKKNHTPRTKKLVKKAKDQILHDTCIGDICS